MDNQLQITSKQVILERLSILGRQNNVGYGTSPTIVYSEETIKLSNQMDTLVLVLTSYDSPRKVLFNIIQQEGKNAYPDLDAIQDLFVNQVNKYTENIQTFLYQEVNFMNPSQTQSLSFSIMPNTSIAVIMYGVSNKSFSLRDDHYVNTPQQRNIQMP